MFQTFLSKRCPYHGCKKFFERGELDEHIVQEHRTVECLNCKRVLKRKSYYRHKRKCPAKPKQFRCTFENCSRIFSSSGNRNYHLRIDHPSSRKVMCPYEDCDKVLKSYGMKLHIESVHERVRAQCHKCGRELLKTSLPHHLQICQNNEESMIECKDKNCHKLFKSKHYMAIHYKNMHCRSQSSRAEKKKPRTKPLSENFLLVHSRLKVTCENCKKQIVQKHLQRHKKTCILVKEDKFLCTEPGCNKYFSNVKCRRNHLYKVHLPLVPCPRKDCDVVIKPASLPRHIRHVHENFRVTCSNCDKEMTYYHLTKHLKLCLGKTQETGSSSASDSETEYSDKEDSESETE